MKKFLFSLLSMLLISLAGYSQTTTVQMHREAGGTYTVPCKVNGLSMRFIFDTGASTVCISATEALFMLKNGYLKQSDIKGRNYSQVASGDIVEGMTINLSSVEIGGLQLNNVEANVVNSISAPLLFGQSAIQKLGPIKLDGDKLIIGKVSVLNLEQRKRQAERLGYKANLANQSGRSEEAIKLFKQAIEMYPSAYCYDGLTYVYGKLGMTEEAIESSEQALALEPTCLQYQYNYAVALYQGKHYDSAEERFKLFYDNAFTQSRNGGISKDALVPLMSVCNFLGDIYQKKGMDRKATEWLYKGIKMSQSINQSNSYAYVHLGDIAFDSAQYQRAIDLYKVGVSDNPNGLNNLPYYYKMGVSYAKIGDSDNSDQNFYKAIQIYRQNKNYTSKDIKDPVGFRLYTYAMESCLQFGRNSFRRFEESNYKGSPILAVTNLCYKTAFDEEYGTYGKNNSFSENDYAKWLCSAFYVNDSVSFKKVSDFLQTNYPRNVDLRYIMAMINNSSKSAILSLLEEAKDSPNFYVLSKPMLLNELAWTQCLAGDFANAEINASSAIKLDGVNPHYWETYGEALYGLGKYNRCIDAMTKCIELSNENDRTLKACLKSAYKFRGDSFCKLGKKSKGNKDIERSKEL